MVKNSFTLYGVTIILEVVRDILYFPAWWYGRGLINFCIGLIGFLKNTEKSLALRVWLKNIFKPMYGQSDWQGILISIFIRLIQIVFRSILLLFSIILSFVLFVFWLFLPILIVYEILIQLNAYIPV